MRYLYLLLLRFVNCICFRVYRLARFFMCKLFAYMYVLVTEAKLFRALDNEISLGNLAIR